MPGMNQQGPLGMGPRTGRGQGRCAHGARLEDDHQGPGEGRRGRGGGRGRRRRMGRMGRGLTPAGGPVGAPELEAEAQDLRRRLARVEAQLAEAGQD